MVVASQENNNKSFLWSVRVEWVIDHKILCVQFADGGYRLHIWRVSANILNKPSLAVENSWSSSLRTTPRANKFLISRKYRTKYYEGLFVTI
jgi:hypothetical protein